MFDRAFIYYNFSPKQDVFAVGGKKSVDYFIVFMFFIVISSWDPDLSASLTKTLFHKNLFSYVF